MRICLVLEHEARFGLYSHLLSYDVAYRLINSAGDRRGSTLGAGCVRKSEIEGHREPRIEIDPPPVPLDGGDSADDCVGRHRQVAREQCVAAENNPDWAVVPFRQTDDAMRDWPPGLAREDDIPYPQLNRLNRRQHQRVAVANCRMHASA